MKLSRRPRFGLLAGLVAIGIALALPVVVSLRARQRFGADAVLPHGQSAAVAALWLAAAILVAVIGVAFVRGTRVPASPLLAVALAPFAYCLMLTRSHRVADTGAEVQDQLLVTAEQLSATSKLLWQAALGSSALAL